jgi:hypothetical protein
MPVPYITAPVGSDSRSASESISELSHHDTSTVVRRHPQFDIGMVSPEAGGREQCRRPGAMLTEVFDSTSPP